MSSEEFRKRVSSAPAGVTIDLGTGDGLFVYHAARQNPHKLYIGIDSNSKPLEKISEKIYRKPTKGGAPNLLYVQASAENLPEDLNEIANEVYVLFPWGSLLQGMANGDAEILQNISRICCKNATLRVMLTLDQDKDQSEMTRLGLPSLSVEYIESILVPRYDDAGFDPIQKRVLTFAELPNLTSWANRLKQNKNRQVFSIIAQRKN